MIPAANKSSSIFPGTFASIVLYTVVAVDPEGRGLLKKIITTMGKFMRLLKKSGMIDKRGTR